MKFKFLRNSRFVLFAGLGIFLSSCALFETSSENTSPVKKVAPQKVFYANPDLVWRAAHTVLRYTIANENQETGYLETEHIKSADGWLPPEATKKPSSGSRYKIIMTFVKGKVEGRESTRVTIEKKMEVVRDFFSEPEQVNSDGLEEKVLFYRMERELVINEALKKLAHSPNE